MASRRLLRWMIAKLFRNRGNLRDFAMGVFVFIAVKVSDRLNVFLAIETENLERNGSRNYYSDDEEI